MARPSYPLKSFLSALSHAPRFTARLVENIAIANAHSSNTLLGRAAPRVFANQNNFRFLA
jgi:hypothetical protein